eukprot:gnl/MRDRNA2_/MRDRNA2_81169_c0_seq4.p1 gnl/MRDRNA2_/MRDRNA2_81169_c0~~gnl/MRDRNA2_/MRDRNA2_81169_c0_seq4.p1  ORF type:complete len:249 (+),score=41.39 gnl/MRDRNA2_/MRDRNA2_81169_c0_seq4:67-747(+)
MCAAVFYSMSGEAVEAHGLDNEECELPGTEEALRARELGIALWSLILTSLVHAIFICFLTKTKTPAPPGQQWTHDTKHQKLRSWLHRDVAGVLVATIYCVFCMVVCVAFLGVAAQRDGHRLLAAVISTHIKMLLWWPMLAAMMATLIVTYNDMMANMQKAGKDAKKAVDSAAHHNQVIQSIKKHLDTKGDKYVVSRTSSKMNPEKQDTKVVDQKPQHVLPCCGWFG